MPWYRSGTVAITAGQTSVVGTNTDFAANARVGDAFQGPDGRWYEVANIASATVLSILPAYQGATVSAGGYGLAPMQGYVKDSADALRTIVNQYGAKLAALGTTGNYDILPVVKGGTGGTNAADARSGLGLGAVATESIVPVTKGGTGVTSLAAFRSALGVRSGDVRWRSNTSNTTIPNGTYTTINWTNDVYGVGGIHSQTSNPDAFVLPVGLYIISASLTYDYAASGRRGIRFTLDNNTFPGCFLLSPVTPGGVTPVTLTILVRITTAGTVLRVQAFQDSGGSLSAPLSGASNVEIYLLGDA